MFIPMLGSTSSESVFFEAQIKWGVFSGATVPTKLEENHVHIRNMGTKCQHCSKYWTHKLHSPTVGRAGWQTNGFWPGCICGPIQSNLCAKSESMKSGHLSKLLCNHLVGTPQTYGCLLQDIDHDLDLLGWNEPRLQTAQTGRVIHMYIHMI